MPKALIADFKQTSGQRKDGKGQWHRYAVKDGNGNWHSTFDGNVGRFLQEHVGKEVELVTSEGERGSDVVSATELSKGSNGENRGRSIERQVALKAAVEAAVASGAANNSDGILAMAQVFYDWIAVEEDTTPETTSFNPDEIPF